MERLGVTGYKISRIAFTSIFNQAEQKRNSGNKLIWENIELDLNKIIKKREKRQLRDLNVKDKENNLCD